MLLTKHDRPITQRHRVKEAIAKGITRSCYYARSCRGIDPVEAADPHYRWRSRWDGVETTASLCRDHGVTRGAVAQWKRRHPDHGLTDAQVVAIVARNKWSRHVQSN